MGMAAGQARLLSITSRMSDNELRAQLINNSKMRLATESSKASEAYVAALNETQMMFTNYGPDDTSSYQELTFNSLTAYNPYNNQYALSNASGQVLVSEKDAQNYVNANGSLDRFLESYGLTKGTTYFDELAKTQLADDGTVIGIGYTPDELKSMYYGTNDHPGYQALLTSDSYFQYQQHNENINSMYETMMDEAWGSAPDQGIQKELLNGGNSAYMINGISYNTFITNTLSGDNEANFYHENYYGSKISDFMKYMDSLTGVLVNGENNQLYKEVKEILGSALESYGLIQRDSNGEFVPDASGNYNISTYNKTSGVNIETPLEYEVSGNTVTIKLDSANLVITNDGTGTYTITKYTDSEGNENDSVSGKTIEEICGIDNANITGSTLTLDQFEVDDNNNVLSEKGYSLSLNLANLFDGDTTNDTATYTCFKSEIEADLKSSFQNAKDLISAKLKYNIDPAAFPSVPQTAAYIEECEKYAKFLFGDNCLDADGGPIKPNDYTSLLTLEGIQNLLTIYPEPDLTISDDFSNVLELLTLENMMDLYGEPKVSWLDSSDTNGSGNAEKKAQWYTNLFERMGNGVKNNFKVLGNGLASSPEWIKFALENGIVTMEQINTSNEWKTVMYSNVSDITEKTSDAAVTKAEAEYKRAMNKIETKDKQYDLELKNIDTEHNSLQTEYDSIKSAIDKNVERTFKLYS